MGRCSYPGCVIRPRTVAPSTNGPSSFTRNHSPNCSATVNARQTRERGAPSVMVFSIRSVVVPVPISNLSVAQYSARRLQMQPHGCAISGVARATGDAAGQKKSRLTEASSGSLNTRASKLVYGCVRGSLRLEPVGGNNRPHDLIQILAVLQQRSPKDAFLHRTELAQGAIAAAVLHGRARLEAVHVRVLEGEINRGPRAREKQARSPEWRADRESPLRDREPRRDRADLHETDRVVVALGHHAERHLTSGLALANRPLDEFLETLRRRRRRRNELRDLRDREHRQKRC